MKNYLKAALIGLALLTPSINGGYQERPTCKDVCAYEEVNKYFRFVQIENATEYEVFCTIRAVNGAYYEFFVYPKTLSRYYKINDIRAQWRWDCDFVR